MHYDAGSPQPWENFPASQWLVQSGSPEGSGSLAAYWQILLRRRWTVLAIMVIMTLGMALASLKTKPVYKSVARIEVESDTPQLQMLNDIYQQLQTDKDFLRSEERRVGKEC